MYVTYICHAILFLRKKIIYNKKKGHAVLQSSISYAWINWISNIVKEKKKRVNVKVAHTLSARSLTITKTVTSRWLLQEHLIIKENKRRIKNSRKYVGIK
jgi:hypothetical protein